MDYMISHHHCRRPLDWSKVFGRVAPLRLEIGFGLGTFLLKEAQDSPECDFVGIEYDRERVERTRRRMEFAGVPNVRLIYLDAVVALERLFEPSVFDKATALFPDPWPKKRHVKHRLFSKEILQLINSRLRAGGELYIVTDYHPYFEWILHESAETGFEAAVKMISARYDTKYERKWLEQGQKGFWEIRMTKQNSVDVPARRDVPLKTYLVDHFDADQFRFENLHGEPSVILKKLVRRSAESFQARFTVAEGRLVQHLGIDVVRSGAGWHVARSEEPPLFSTEGIALALDLFVQAIEATPIREAREFLNAQL